MSTTRSRSGVGMTASFTIVLVLAVVLWAATVANATTIRSSDAAGNALSHAFGVLMVLALFVLLAILLVLSAVRGEMPGSVRLALVVLVPASGAATIAAIEILAETTEWPVKWPLVVPALAPALLIAFALWTCVPSVRALASPTAARSVILATLTLLSIAPWRLLRERGRIRNGGPGELEAIRAAKRERWTAADRDAERAEFEALDPQASLYSWLLYTDPGDPLRDRALASISRLIVRQAEAEELVRSGNVTAIREIPNLHLEPTASLCDAARESIVFHARRVRPRDGSRPAYALYARDVEYYLPTIEWLAQRGCSLADALTELETTASSYADSPERERFVGRLRSLQTAGATGKPAGPA